MAEGLQRRTEAVFLGCYQHSPHIISFEAVVRELLYLSSAGNHSSSDQAAAKLSKPRSAFCCFKRLWNKGVYGGARKRCNGVASREKKQGNTKKGNTFKKKMLLALLRIRRRIEMLYLLERVENMQIFAYEKLLFFAFPSINYANGTHHAAGSRRSHTQHVMHKQAHAHTQCVNAAGKDTCLGCSTAAQQPSLRDKQGRGARQ